MKKLFSFISFTAMKKLFSFILMALLPVVASAADAYVNGIFYNLSGDEASVTYERYDEDSLCYVSHYTGDIVLPASITYQGKTYSVTSIGGRAFSDSRSLKSVTIPESVTSIGASAFCGCKNLVSIIIPSSVTGIASEVFRDCSNLTSVSIGDGVKSIGDHAFEGCYNLLSVTIPNSVVSIEGNAFYGCKGLTNVTIPGSVKSIGSKAFYDCSGLTSLTIDDGVTSIGNASFAGCTSLPSVTLPSSVTSIDESAFSYCTSLATVNIPESVTNIGHYAFNNTAWFNNQPDGIVYLGRVAYIYKGEMPEGTEISIKDGTVQIASYAFNDCKGLVSIILPENVECISSYAFSGCEGLTSITLPESVTSIGSYAFSGCKGLTSVTIPDGVTDICDGVFNVCPSLTSVIIPDGVKRIGNNAFNDCISLTSITLPESVTSIGKWAFIGCKSLTSIVIPNKVTSIGYAAFSQCSGLKVVTISSSMKQIDKGAFNACSSLTDVFCLAENVPSTESNAFMSSSIGVATLHVPEGAVEKYRKSSPWSGFGNIVALPAPVTFTAGKMATIILPTAPDTEWGKYYRLDRCEDNYIVFVEELQPQARTPYIIVPSEDFSINLGTLDLTGLTHDAVSIEGVSFIGSYTTEELNEAEGFYINLIDTTPDCWTEAGGSFVIGALHAYLQVNWDDPFSQDGTRAPREKMEVVLLDEGDGIDEIQNSEFNIQDGEGPAIYDLSGRKLFGKPTNGIYIVDGKKVAIR